MAHARAAQLPGTEVSRDGLQQFLNPASMMTPGFAGALTMMITNALVQQFPVEPGYAGIGLSFLFGTLVLSSKGALWTRLVYYVLNSLIIFCVAMGANHAGIAAASSAAPAPQPAAAHGEAPTMAAQPEALTGGQPGGLAAEVRTRGLRAPGAPEASRQLLEEKQRLEQEAARLREENAKLRAAVPPANSHGFFRPWFQQPEASGR